MHLVDVKFDMARRRKVIHSVLQKYILYACEEISDILINDVLNKNKCVWVRKWLSRRNELYSLLQTLKNLIIEKCTLS